MPDTDWRNIPEYKENLAVFDERVSQWFGHRLPAGQRASHENMPKASQIVEFWFRWGELHSKEGLSGQLPAFVQDLIIDLGEPFCFSCRTRFVGRKFVATKTTATLPGLTALYKHWNKLPLERAHIIPLSRGGSNRLRNLLLLCRTCHRDAPDVVDSSIMLTWLQNRKQTLLNRRLREWVEACSQIGVDPELVFKQRIEIREKWRDEFKAFSLDFSVPHFDTYSTASEVACIIEFAKQKGIKGVSL
jgi:5-methylcytosine-specific restriction endonuclease McrA